jgi:acetolactate synthase-1/2/3 large subunit
MMQFLIKKLQHILVRHEQGATHAADGYARATGKPGVVLWLHLDQVQQMQ